jgi:DnaJ-class molecular chaperone
MYYNCWYCDGRGIRPGTCSCACEACKGIGFTFTENYCVYCDGRGRRLGSFLGLAKCLACKGKGKGRKYLCQHCSGKERDPKCERCHGSGHVVCDDCSGATRVELFDQMAKLEIVANSFTTGDSDLGYYERGPLKELTALQVDALINKVHKEVSTRGGISILPVRYNRDKLDVRPRSGSSHQNLYIYRVGDDQYVVYGYGGGYSRGYS